MYFTMSPSASVVVLTCLVVVVLVVEAAVVPPPDTKIMGGHEIEITDAPWQVFILADGHLYSGGAIINSRWVLTSAYYPSGIPMGLFKIRIGSKLAHEGGKLYDVFKVVVHEEFAVNEGMHDICLMKTTTPLDLSAPVKAVKLPSLGQKRPAVGTSLTVTGWGKTEDETYSDSLRAVEVEIKDFKECAEFAFSKEETSICAGLRGKSFCDGDVGSPLVMDDLLVGVASHGEDRGNPNVTCGYSPSLYMDVAYYRDWIDLHTNPPDCQQPL